MKAEVQQIISSASDESLGTSIVSSYAAVEKAYVLKDWKSGGIEAGHFVEGVRRFLDLKLSSTYVPMGKQLPNFTEQELQRLSNLKGDDSLRLIIPRILFAVYAIRNKRGIGHLSTILANRMDAEFILQACKWTMGELVRLYSTAGEAKTAALVQRLSTRHIEGFWSDGDVERVLIDGLTLKQKVIFYLNNKEEAGFDKILGVMEVAG